MQLLYLSHGNNTHTHYSECAGSDIHSTMYTVFYFVSFIYPLLFKFIIYYSIILIHIFSSFPEFNIIFVHNNILKLVSIATNNNYFLA